MTDLSSLPVRLPGTRSRAGNAMARTRAAVLDGALKALTKQGVRATTMGDVATLGGVAKATLYNHFRRKEDVWRALADAEVRRIVADCLPLANQDLVIALDAAADRVATHPAVRRIAAEEPQMLGALTAPDPSSPAWNTAVCGVRAMLEAAGRPPSPGAIDLVLRWLLSHIGMAGTEESRRSGAAQLASTLSAV